MVLNFVQCCLRSNCIVACRYLLSWNQGTCKVADGLCRSKHLVSNGFNLLSTFLDLKKCFSRLCLAVIIGLPAATPAEFKNSASYALGNFSNGNIAPCPCTSKVILIDMLTSQWMVQRIRVHFKFLGTPLDYLYVLSMRRRSSRTDLSHPRFI